MSYYGNFRTRTFAEIFPTDTAFAAYYNNCGMPATLQTGSDYTNYSINVIYALLMSRYSFEHIAMASEDRFKLRVMAIIYEAGPVWQREMYLNHKLATLTDTELVSGAKQVSNNALHPDGAPSTASTDELEYISSQNVSKYTKSKVTGFTEASAGLDDGICDRFLNRFKKLFLKVVYPDSPLLYTTEDSSDDT